MIAHKVVSKARGPHASLAEIEPGAQALELAAAHGKDPRHVQAILDESEEIVRAQRGVLIVRTHHGFVCANAGIDESNTARDGTLCCCRATPTPRRARSALGCASSRGVLRPS